MTVLARPCIKGHEIETFCAYVAAYMHGSNEVHPLCHNPCVGRSYARNHVVLPKTVRFRGIDAAQIDRVGLETHIWGMGWYTWHVEKEKIHK
jgi:hypothetical protein